MTISSRDSYRSQGETHVSKNKIASWKEIEQAKKHSLNHVFALNHIFMTGQDNPNTVERLHRDLNEDRTIVPDLILTQKNQKPIDPETGLPKTRPVCLSRVNFNQRANDYLCQLLGAPIKADPTAEANSTEDALSKIDSLNSKLEKGQIKPRNLTLGSLDVKSLYTSINTKVAGIKANHSLKA